MAAERSTQQTHDADRNQLDYDKSYYDALIDYGDIKGKVLDVGAGALMFVKQYIDLHPVKSVLAIDKHQEDYAHSKLKLKEWQMPDNLPKGEFDTIISTEFIEHITRNDFNLLLPQIKERLAKEGNFIGSTPNKVQPTTNPYHLYEYTLEELKEILEDNFRKVQIWDTGKYCTVWIAQSPKSPL